MAKTCPECNFDNTSDSKFCKECGTPLSPSEKIPSRTETLETPIKELTRGATFAGRYEIIEELGQGGMGKVYRVEDNKIKAEIALKLIRPDISVDKKTIERFGNELKTTRMISQRHVCRMFDIGEDKGTYFITMEYVPGEDLKSLIRMSKRLEVGTAISIARQVCDGLAEAQRFGVVHRDLKPSNIMIDKDENARIMDFGIARSLQAKGITGTGVIIGTPEYMSPEQAETMAMDQRSDIYSLGVILYEMVTGSVPFEGDTALSIVMKHRTEEPKDPRKVNPLVPESFGRLILKCLEKKPERRYDSVQEIARELDIALEGILLGGKSSPTVTGTSRTGDERKSAKRSWDLDQAAMEKNLERIIAYSQLSIKDDIVHVTFSRTDRIVTAINDVTKNIPWDPDEVLFINQGGGEITLIFDREKKALFQGILAQAIEVREKAAVI
jgi:serine/threonine protein kinase